MKQYYLEQTMKAQLALDLAKIGFESCVRKLGEELTKCDEESFVVIISELCDARNLLADMTKEVDDYRRRYLAECERGADNGVSD